MSSDRLAVGEMNYSTVIVPNMVTIRSTTLDILEAFEEKGGKILFMGRIPELVDGKKSDRAYMLAARCSCIGKGRSELYAALEEARDIEICKGNGFRSDNLFYQLRQDNTCKLLFICHVERKLQHISDIEKYQIRIKGRYEVTLYDTQTGKIAPVQSRVEGDYTVVVCDMYAEDSVLYQLQEVGEDCLDMDCQTVPIYQTVQKLTQAEAYHRQEKNVVLLDYARYRVDDGDIHEKEEILRLDNKIREQLGFVLRKDRMNQPYHMEEKEAHTVTLYYDLESEIDTPAFLAIEELNACQIWLNGESIQKEVTGYYVDPAITVIALPKIKAGYNELIVQVDYNQKTNLENLFVLGDFVVALRGNQPRIVREESGLSIGDITSQGMPFYTGNLEYTFRFGIEDEEAEYYVHIPHFKAPLLGVSVDGSRKGLMAYALHRQKLGKLTKGSHELMICLYGNRFNGFGTLHNANDDFLWYGPDSFRTTGDDWTDSYRIRPVGIFSAVEIQKR